MVIVLTSVGVGVYNALTHSGVRLPQGLNK